MSGLLSCELGGSGEIHCAPASLKPFPASGRFSYGNAPVVPWTYSQERAWKASCWSTLVFRTRDAVGQPRVPTQMFPEQPQLAPAPDRQDPLSGPAPSESQECAEPSLSLCPGYLFPTHLFQGVTSQGTTPGVRNTNTAVACGRACSSSALTTSHLSLEGFSLPPWV